MIETITYHGTLLDIVKSTTDRICYILLPEGLKDDGHMWMEDAAGRYGITLVVISGMNWNDDLTPWSADGVFRKSKTFGGRAELFLKNLRDDYFPNIESTIGIRNPERYLIGISLSGLFAVWSVFKCDLFDAVASISGSLWYDGFASWTEGQKLSERLRKVSVFLGDREKKSKDKRMSTVEDETLRSVEIMRRKGASVEFVLEENTTHFSPVVPRLEKALVSLTKVDEIDH